MRINRTKRAVYHVALGLDLTTSYSRQKLQGVLAWYRKHGGWRIAMRNAQPFLSNRQLAQFKGDGIIGEFFDEKQIPDLRTMSIPIVNTSGGLLEGAMPTVCLDDEAIGATVASHLLERGFRNLYYVGQKNKIISRLRYDGFRKVAERAGVTTKAHWLDFPLNDQKLAQAQTYEEFVKSIQRHPAGVFCMTDRLAYGVLEACRVLGVRVPWDVAVVGSNNDEVLCQLADPTLSSVDESATAVGYRAAEMLHELMTGGGVESFCVRIAPANLRIRASSDRFTDDSEDLRQAIQFIRAHSHTSVNVADVMRHVQISRRTLENLFREKIGHGIYREILKTRIERACTLLRDGDDSILEVAYKCGFQSLQRFEANFAEFCNCSASAYRQKHLSNRL